MREITSKMHTFAVQRNSTCANTKHELNVAYSSLPKVQVHLIIIVAVLIKVPQSNNI